MIEKAINELYTNELKKYGEDDRRSIFWTKDKQDMRFNLLLGEEYKKSNMSILDYGCGLCDLNSFLQRNFYSLRYNGCDINKNFVEISQGKFPSHNIFMIESSKDIRDNYDIILVSGTFNLLTIESKEEMNKYVFQQLINLFEHTNYMLSVNFLSHLTDKEYQYNGHYYVDPSELYEFSIKNMTKRVTIDTASLPYEITMKFYKNETLIPKLVLYND